MHPLLIEVDGRVVRFDGDSPIRIGRSIDADVVLSSSSVSRAHAELRPGPAGWLLVDVGSAGGTFIGGNRVTEVPLAGRVQVQLGPVGDGALITITPEPDAAPELSAASQPPAAGGYDLTVVPGTPMPRIPEPGQPVGPPQPPTGPDLLIVAEGREFRFHHPSQVTIGRQPDCDIVVDDPAASRQHARVVAVPNGWVFENHSQAGSYVDGRQVGTMPFDEATTVRLGHPVAGELIQLVPILSAQEELRRFAAKRRNRTLKRVGVGAAAVVLLGGTLATALIAGGGDGAQGFTAEERDNAKAATVLLSFEVDIDDDGETDGTLTGSGSIIDSSGLILTNAHVADPNNKDLEELYGESDIEIPDPDYIEVWLTHGEDGYRTGDEPDYRAEVINADGKLDAAVIQITATGDGKKVDGLDLPTMPLGETEGITQGDPVSVIGFPAIARAEGARTKSLEKTSISVTGGNISSIITRKDEVFEFETDARIAGGNSGGAAVNDDGELIGIPSAIRLERDSPVVSGRIRAIAAVMDLIEEARSEVD